MVIGFCGECDQIPAKTSRFGYAVARVVKSFVDSSALGDTGGVFDTRCPRGDRARDRLLIKPPCTGLRPVVGVADIVDAQEFRETLSKIRAAQTVARTWRLPSRAQTNSLTYAGSTRQQDD